MSFSNPPVTWQPPSITPDQMAGCYALYPVAGLTEIEINAAVLTQGLGIDSQPDLTAISAPNCTTVLGDLAYNDAASFWIANCPNLVSIDFPVLAETSGNAGFFGIIANPLLTSINMPKLMTDGTQRLDIMQNAALTTIDLPAVTTFGNLNFSANPSLTSITLPPLTGAGIIGFNNNALTAECVNAVLALLVAANGGTWASGASLNGGTNAAPTGQGILDVATLTGRGASVVTN